MAMVNMKHSREEASKYTEPAEVGDEPQYPYGLCISLHEDELEKLGITSLPAVGTEMALMAKVYVKSTSSYQTQEGGSNMSVDLQITYMEIGAASTQSAAATALYGTSSEEVRVPHPPVHRFRP